MRKDLLLAIAQVVRETPEEEFDMGSWACGTTGCAIGKSILKGVLPMLELTTIGTLTPTGIILNGRFLYPHLIGTEICMPIMNGHGLPSNYGTSAVAQALEIGQAAADWLFVNYAEGTKEEVLERIEHFISTGKCSFDE